MVGRTAPAPRCVSRDYRCRGDPNRGFVWRSHQNRKGAKGDFARETCRGNLRRISKAKSHYVRRTWIPTTSLLTPPGPPNDYPENQLHAAGSPAKHGGFHHDKGCSNAFGDNPMRVLVPLLEFNPSSKTFRAFSFGRMILRKA